MRQVGVALKNVTDPFPGGGGGGREKSGKYYRDKTKILRTPTPLPGDK